MKINQHLVLGAFLSLCSFLSCTKQDPLTYVDEFVYAFELDQEVPLISEDFPELSEDQAYRVQKKFVQKILTHENIGGYKASFIDSKLTDQKAPIKPIFSVIFESNIRPNNSKISLYGIHNPVLETYLGFTFKKDITTHIKSIEELKTLIDTYQLIGDITDLKFEELEETQTVDFIASNAVSTCLFIGDTTEYIGQDFHNSTIQISHNNTILDEVTPKRNTHSALKDLLWLINMTIDNGYIIDKGKVLTIGDKINMIPLKVGHYVMDTQTSGLLSFKITR